MAAYQCITFLTDYGLDDGFVAACHGVAARLAPEIRLIDITHLVPPGDVRRGAAVLAQTVPYLPAGVHVAVVDPGVGTARRGVAVQSGGRVFVGPDNGLLSWAATVPSRAYELTNEELWLSPVSATFHGRDVFMPVAARLAAGLPLAEVGREIGPAELVALPAPTRLVRDGAAEGEVVTVDRFGNVQLAVTGADLDRLGAVRGATLTVTVGRRRLVVPYLETFGSVPPGELVAYTDSAGLVALAVNGGDAAQRLGLPPGARVRLSR
ncbi:SAM hydrolase/SAM-dependent halogenase family protein [Actinomadura craniellae]|uniref:SAM hydrolase/SAM-dependent halogenase family protein n=1 Tax=Actinomadura craniellae TaxID=2231787 RepID=UPI0011BE60F2|nr:SAM-dependent chlorinase/fluorinase [Actinomadura craniellae]